jgi:hypothetical protein
MSSHHITVAGLIGILKQYPPDLLVAMPSPVQPGELFEGMLDGPRYFQRIAVNDVRTGFNPLMLDTQTEHAWDVLLIRTNDHVMHWDWSGETYGLCGGSIDDELAKGQRQWKDEDA